MEKIYNENEVSDIAKDILGELNSSSESSALLVTLSGDLGAGKTTLVQEIARHLGIKESVVSPTYVIMKKYHIEHNDKFSFLIHIDAYRLHGDQELINIGWNDILKDSKNIVMLEWPEKVPQISSNPNLAVSLTHHDNNSRKVVMVRYTTTNVK